MYSILTISDRVRVSPQFFGMKLGDAVTQILRERYERRIDRDIGVVLSVWGAKPSGSGIVIPGDGAAYYDVTFQALTFLPTVNEIVEAEVSELVEFGAFLNIGPFEGLAHLSQIANDFLTFNKKAMAIQGKESKKILKKGDIVVAKISTVSMKSSIPETKVGLTMRPEGLGKAEWVEERERKRESGGDEKEKKGKKEKEDKPEKKEKKE